MKIVVVGAGITGLVAARLLAKKHHVIVIEQNLVVGGLAETIRYPKHRWPIEKAYHHWFTNDNHALKLASELAIPVDIYQPVSSVYRNGYYFRLDDPWSLLTYPDLSLFSRLRMGLTLMLMKIAPNENVWGTLKAVQWAKRWMGKEAYQQIWDPLLTGKFHQYKSKVLLAWFWARVKKRTTKLAYPRGGFAAISARLIKELSAQGVQIKLGIKVKKITQSKDQVKIVTDAGKIIAADYTLFTGPSMILDKLMGNVRTQKYTESLTAQVMLLRLNKPLMKGVYWLNVTDTRFPFLVVVEHTNMMSSQNYHNEHLVYIGNYLPVGHPYLGLSKKELLQKFDPWITQINPHYQANLIGFDVFTLPFAQPVVDAAYKERVQTTKRRIGRIFRSSMDLIFPWDRGTNYAVSHGEEIARQMLLAMKEHK